jgi:hypothetical protein
VADKAVPGWEGVSKGRPVANWLGSGYGFVRLGARGAGLAWLRGALVFSLSVLAFVDVVTASFGVPYQTQESFGVFVSNRGRFGRSYQTVEYFKLVVSNRVHPSARGAVR